MALLGLPKGAEYAIKILIFLALSSGRPVPAVEVARGVRIPPSQAAKILHFLRWARLTRSRRGARGGYLLRQAPEEIHLGQVIELFQLAPEDEASAALDPLLQVLAETSAQSEQEWQQLTIAELARRTAGQWARPAPGMERTSSRKPLEKDRPPKLGKSN